MLIWKERSAECTYCFLGPMFVRPTCLDPYSDALTERRCACAVLAYLIAAVSPTMEVANGALPAYVVILLFFVGQLIRPQDQPPYWHWCGHIQKR